MEWDGLEISTWVLGCVVMKIEDFGCFGLVDKSNKRYDLKFGANLVAAKNDVIVIDQVLSEADCMFVINVTDKINHIIRIFGNILVDGREITSNILIEDGITFFAGKIELNFMFSCKSSAIEKLIDSFMEGNLDIKLNMENIFYEYAKLLAITDRKAISNIMAAIDIPEVDRI